MKVIEIIKHYGNFYRYTAVIILYVLIYLFTNVTRHI